LLEATPISTTEFFREQKSLLNQELHMVAPKSWPKPELYSKVRFPKQPMFARDGAAIIHFSCAAKCMSVVVIIANSATGNGTGDCE
jgi:uncharacterized protein YdhG (YjbR/CyaY superfamily)